jgi:transposase InsO family protein
MLSGELAVLQAPMFGSLSGAGQVRAVARGAGGALHRRAALLRVESTVYRLLKAHDLITSPAYVVIKAADLFHIEITRPNEMWQTDFTYFNIIGWG